MLQFFRFLVRPVLCIAAVFLSLSLWGQHQVILHYNFGRAGAVTYANGPDKIFSVNGTNQLKKSGQPVFFADAPADEKLNGEGSILLKDNAAYTSKDSFAIADSPFILELWLQANARQGANDPAPVFATVATLGNGKKGFQLAQKGFNWVLLVDGVEVTTPLAAIQPGEWTHIALVSDGKSGTVYINGQKKNVFKPSGENVAGFSIGAAGRVNSFRGLVYEVRLSNWKATKFDAARFLLYNPKQIAQKQQQATEQQKALLASLLKNQQIKQVTQFPATGTAPDWLINKVNTAVQALLQPGADGLTAKLLLTNGLISREFYIADNLACVSFKNHLDDAEFLRAIKPEARVMIDSTWYNVGGLSGQPEKSYLLEGWYKDMMAEPSAFRFAGLELKKPQARYPWQQKYNAVHIEWPPKGLHMVMHYQAPLSKGDWKNTVSIDIHYELYEGMPVIAKWMTVDNKSNQAFVVRETECEVLAVNQDQVKRIHVESDYSFALANADVEGSALMHYKGTPPAYQVGSSTTTWRVDAEYNTWASHNQAEDKFLGFPHHSLLVSRVPMGPSETVLPNGTFTSFTTFELLQDSDDRERQSLAHRRMYRKLAPQVTESLITGGITSHDRTELKNFITQMGELGFERLDIQAWPGISHDNLDTAYVSLWKEIAGFAKTKGIVLGGYELQVASRGRGAEYDCIDPLTDKPGSLFGQSVCIASRWKDVYYPKMWKFFDATGLMTYNMDGPYHGDVCAATNHAHHKGMFDSQWEQWKTQVEVLHELQRRNMYVPIPDWYFLNGQAATGMGYREASANLTPQQQLLLGRQYIYDGTWHKTPTMGWMSLQLVGFYTNDPRVGLEPLNKNIDRYEVGLFQHLASGCQFTLRGRRLYDTPETKAMVDKWIKWFKQHRAILTSDIIHIARPTGRDLDAMFHVNPFIEEKGMLIIFNPTEKTISKQFKLPLYYTGIKNKAKLINEKGEIKQYELNNQQEIMLDVTIPAEGFSWFVVNG
ncbi:LamG-like jellyroll fold domain-containing protein [Terrimonas alba]|uniref:LamG-like jellyroll fold domain-containing protein n=1 Tax=Terrimonas alba TaxID=3349636 RepID=UPI0035F2387C